MAAIIDYGMGNLFSVKHACLSVGLKGVLTSSEEKIRSADAVILPGVGAFPDAMNALRDLGLSSVLREIAGMEKPFLAICLGMQLLMSKSMEFGCHEGLDIIKGEVKHFGNPVDQLGGRLKVPEIGWNRIYKSAHKENSDMWSETLLDGLEGGEYMYFVHSFYADPQEKDIVLSESQYGNIRFCSSLRYKNIFACQFHPERSALSGLKIYKNFALSTRRSKGDRYREDPGSAIRTA
ncbi:MAG: imidazole glycerol phosphate synthase subunit HisH [Candidatus Omnitrophica bacterium]|nr:imidazole glycerol phosphate synthase subunit HisH [Candidatus Omnitrophota bacterium]